jgi:hypothetical protein
MEFSFSVPQNGRSEIQRHGQKHNQIVRVNAGEQTRHHGRRRSRNSHDYSNASQDDTLS